jgi:tetratricopeptide (TPR) repeat protein
MRDALRYRRRYVRLAWIWVRNFSLLTPIIPKAVEAALYGGGKKPSDQAARNLTAWRALLVMLRISVTCWLVNDLLNSGMRGAEWWLLPVFVLRYPRLPFWSVLLPYVALVTMNPWIGFLALLRLFIEVALTDVVSPFGWRRGWRKPTELRPHALEQRDRDRQNFWRSMDLQTAEAWTRASSTDWSESRLTFDEVDDTFALGKVHEVARDTSGTQTRLFNRAEGWSTDGRPLGRLRDAYDETASLRGERQTILDLTTAVAAGLLGAATGTKGFDLSFNLLLAFRITGVRARVAHGVFCAVLIFVIRDKDARRRRLLLAASVAAALLWRSPQTLLIAFGLAALASAGFGRSNDPFRRARHPLRIRALLTPRRASLVVDRWFAGRQARADAELALPSFERLVDAFSERNLGREASWCALEIAILMRSRGEMQAALDRLRAIEPYGDRRLEAILRLEEGRTLWLIGDQSEARRSLEAATSQFVDLVDRHGCAESTNALGVLEAASGRLDRADRLTRRARRLALQVPNGGILLVDNELTRSEILLKQGKPLEAEEAAADVESYIDEGLLVPFTSRILRYLNTSGLGDARVGIVRARAAVAHAAALNSAKKGNEAARVLRPVLDILGSLHAPLDAADAYFALAHALESEGQHAEALDAALSALALLGVERHRLTTQPSRARWFERNRAVLDFALELAVAVGDHRTAAELIEVTRTQAVPSSASHVPTTPIAVLEVGHLETSSATFRGLGPTSFALEAMGELPLAAPPVIRVRGVSKLGDRRMETLDEVVIDLEVAMRDVGGPGTWWLGYWASSRALFWAVVPGTGEPVSGSLPLGPDDELRAVLAELAVAVPVGLPGENGDEMVDRVEAGPLGGRPWRSAARIREAAFSRRLGRALLPDVLTAAAQARRAAGAGLLPLAISPCAELANVPWALVGVDDPAHADTRLHDLTDWRLTPSSALMHVLSSRARPGASPPVRAAIIDPSGRAPSEDPSVAARAGDLLGARDVVPLLPAGATVLTGQWDAAGHVSGTSVLATYENLQVELARIGPDATLLIAAHCDNPDAERPSSSGVIIAASGIDDTDWLSARDLLVGRTQPSGHTKPLVLPRRLIVSACDSSGATTARFGEWLSFGPAALFAGADAVVVTQFPIRDDPAIERALLETLNGAITLAEALRSVISRHLDAWRQGRGMQPLLWSGYALLGRFEDAT